MSTTHLKRFPVPVPSMNWQHQGLRAAKAACALSMLLAVGCAEPLPAPADVAAPPSDATVTNSSLAYKVLRKGDGAVHPTGTSTVRVHYTGWTTDGEMFDSSVTRGEPAEFPLNAVIAGWTEGVQLMVVNESTRFWIPENLAYKGQSGKPAGTLVFDIELLAIK